MNDEEARDAISQTINAAWLADPTTSGLELHWSDRRRDPPGPDADGKAPAYGKVLAPDFFAATEDALGGKGVGDIETTGSVVIEIRTPFNDGHVLADDIVRVLKEATKGVQVGDLWFLAPLGQVVGQEGNYLLTRFQVPVRFLEVV